MKAKTLVPSGVTTRESWWPMDNLASQSMAPVELETRQVRLTFTHEKCGDRFFSPMMTDAYLEWRGALRHAIVTDDMADYRAQNGVLIQIEVPPVIGLDVEPEANHG